MTAREASPRRCKADLAVKTSLDWPGSKRRKAGSQGGTDGAKSGLGPCDDWLDTR